jgi:hypothetical protein
MFSQLTADRKGESTRKGDSWQKVLPKGSNVAKEKIKSQEKLTAEIRHNFTKSNRKVAEENVQQ